MALRSGDAGAGRRSHLSDVVSNLVRASLGQKTSSEIPEDLKGDDLDQYIADLIVQESRQRNVEASSSSSSANNRTGAGTPSASRAAPTNKQFLGNLIRATEGHNRAVIRQIEREAHEGQRQRAAETAQGSHRNVHREGTRREGRSPFDSQPPSRSSSRNQRERLRGDSPVRRRSDGTSKMRGFSSDEDVVNEDVVFDDPRGSRPGKRESTGSRARETHESRPELLSSHRRTHSPGRREWPPSHAGSATVAAPETSSKMDKYFEADYDPRLDLPETTVADATDPKTGLISDAGWDQMLAIMREKEEMKAAKKRAEKEKRRAEKEERREERRERRQERSKRKERSRAGSDDEREHHRHHSRTSPESEHRHGREDRRHAKRRDDRELSDRRSHSTRDNRDTEHRRGHRRRDREPAYSSRSRSRSPSPKRSRPSIERPTSNDTALMEVRYPKAREWDLGKKDLSF